MLQPWLQRKKNRCVSFFSNALTNRNSRFLSHCELQISAPPRHYIPPSRSWIPRKTDRRRSRRHCSEVNRWETCKVGNKWIAYAAGRKEREEISSLSGRQFDADFTNLCPPASNRAGNCGGGIFVCKQNHEKKSRLKEKRIWLEREREREREIAERERDFSSCFMSDLC